MNARVEGRRSSVRRWYGLARDRLLGDPVNELLELDRTDPVSRTPAARPLARALLSGVGTRFAHSQGVVRQVRRADWLVDARWRSAITRAAWLHDIGYSEHVADTGFHQLDGARWLRDHGRLLDWCRLVAWHTGSDVEGRLRGLHAELVAEFDPPPPLATAILTWADVTTSPVGAMWTAERRLTDILERHPADSIVHRAIVATWPSLLLAARTVESLLVDRGAVR